MRLGLAHPREMLPVVSMNTMEADDARWLSRFGGYYYVDPLVSIMGESSQLLTDPC